MRPACTSAAKDFTFESASLIAAVDATSRCFWSRSDYGDIGCGRYRAQPRITVPSSVTSAEYG